MAIHRGPLMNPVRSSHHRHTIRFPLFAIKLLPPRSRDMGCWTDRSPLSLHHKKSVTTFVARGVV